MNWMFSMKIPIPMGCVVFAGRCEIVTRVAGVLHIP
jgi:hypothetical protein